jgi:UDP-glucuronate 4-epimerase
LVYTLVTGAAGFIGFHLCRRLLAEGVPVVGIDSLNDYYDIALKEARLAELTPFPAFEFMRLDLADRDSTDRLFAKNHFDLVLHMAAQAGVRYSLENPHAYAESNLVGFLNILEGCRQNSINHLVYASSSSVYGDSSKFPLSTSDPVDHPISLYAATKKSNELMAHVYSHLYGLPTTGLRFFTVYGPWGRPDMAIYKFAQAIMQGKPIDVYNHGKMRRSFTYIDDVVEGVLRVACQPPDTNLGGDGTAPYRIYNIGNDQSVELEEMIALLETALGKKAIKNYLPLQAGDVKDTAADIEDLRQAVGYAPTTALAEGIKRFAEWYLEYSSTRAL